MNIHFCENFSEKQQWTLLSLDFYEFLCFTSFKRFKNFIEYFHSLNVNFDKERERKRKRGREKEKDFDEKISTESNDKPSYILLFS